MSAGIIRDLRCACGGPWPEGELRTNHTRRAAVGWLVARPVDCDSRTRHRWTIGRSTGVRVRFGDIPAEPAR
jgi:hypothetical protein